jgi:hypothetical protein
MVKAIAVDMDGTFLDSKKNYDKERFEYIYQQLQQKGLSLLQRAAINMLN